MLFREAEVTKSLSNLYKPWYVRAESAGARIIDSNAVMNEHLKKNVIHAGNPDEVTAEHAFAEGIVPEENENVIKIEEDTILLARKEAERILEEAREETESLLKQAEMEIEGIRETAHKKGYQEGQTQLERELSERQGQLEGAYREKAAALEQDYLTKQEQMEEELVDVILEVFNKVFHIQFDNKKHILMHLINDAIMDIEGEKRFRIKVSEDNVQFLENHKEDIMDRVGHDIELEILTDSTMDGNVCVIETESGVFDCSLGTQLENLMKDIRSLCS